MKALDMRNANPLDPRLFGARPDAFDKRDHKASRGLRAMLGLLPKAFTSRPTIDKFDLILDQGFEGSCVANAFALTAAVMSAKTGAPLELSRRWIMSNAQELDEWPSTSPTGEDGTSLRAAIKAGDKRGLVLEGTIPYVAGNRLIEWNDKLRLAVAAEAARFRVKSYQSLMARSKPVDVLIQQAVMRAGAIAVSAALPSSFMNLDLGNSVVTEGKDNLGMHAFHAFTIVGWKQTPTHGLCWEIANSWGRGWGAQGFALWPAATFAKRCQSAWTFSL